jgi:hypothetical protein
MSDPTRKERLRACETILRQHMEEFVRVGLALKEIRDARLYLADDFQNFETYCRRKWSFSRQRAHQLIDASEIRQVLPELPCQPGVDMQWNEKAIRELGRLPTTAKARAVAERIVKDIEKAGGKLTSGIVKKAVDKDLGLDPKPKPDPLPSMDEVLIRYHGQLLGMADVLEKIPQDAIELWAIRNSLSAERFVRAAERIADVAKRLAKRRAAP